MSWAAMETGFRHEAQTAQMGMGVLLPLLLNVVGAGVGPARLAAVNVPRSTRCRPATPHQFGSPEQASMMTETQIR